MMQVFVRMQIFLFVLQCTLKLYLEIICCRTKNIIILMTVMMKTDTYMSLNLKHLANQFLK